MKSLLFSPLKIRDLEIRNRVFMAPMCQYSAIEGVANDWHKVHLATRAIGGVGLVLVEATGIRPEGRITDHCLGIYNEEQVQAFFSIVKTVHQQGAKIGLQLAHSGRKGVGSFDIVAPSAMAFDSNYRIPKELDENEIEQIAQAFLEAAKRALTAGFDLVEIHMAHGYLLHQFLSPYSNKRTDQYGGSLENRMRLPLKIARMIRDFWPQNRPVFVRLSATDWTEKSSWNINEAVLFVKELQKLGVDFIDVSTGGNVSGVKIPVSENYQVTFAQQIKKQTGILTGAVGLITQAQQAEAILKENQADAILLGRVLLRDPYWAINAARNLDNANLFPVQYERAY